MYRSAFDAFKRIHKDEYRKRYPNIQEVIFYINHLDIRCYEERMGLVARGLKGGLRKALSR